MQRLGPYQIVRRLGAGGSAEVFLARGPTPKGEAELALKLILPHLADDGGHRAMLLREAKMVMPLRHPNVVEVYDIGEIDGRTFLALEYLSGWPLNAFVRALRDRKQKLTLSEASHLVREAALGLHHAHEAKDENGAPLGIVHRDVSPHNLMLSREGHIKVVDFGLARATNASATQTGGLKGKLRYMPPEQLRSEALDRRVDVFALGAILWDLALGQPLHPGPTEADIFQQALFAPQPHPDEVAKGLPRAFVDVLQRSVAREADKRFASAQELADALTQFVGDDAAEKVATIAAEVLGAMDVAPPRTSRDDVPAWEAPPAAAPPGPPAPPQTGGHDARVAQSLSKMPRVKAGAVQYGKRNTASQPPAPARSASSEGISHDTVPRAPPQRPSDVATERTFEQDTMPNLAPRRRPGDDDVSQTDAEALPMGRSLAARLVPLVVIALLAGAGIVLVLRGFGIFGTQTNAAEGIPQPKPAQSTTTTADTPPTAPTGPTGATGSTGDATAAHPVEEIAPVDKRPRGGTATLVLTSDRPAVARSGSTDLGMTPITVKLPAGKHRIRLESLDGQLRTSVDVNVPVTGTIQKHVVLAKP